MHVVLVHPEIPQNTGSIARTCAATGIGLHLIHPLGFDISEKRVRRAGLDYWPFVELHEHASWEEYSASMQPPRLWALTKFGATPYHQAAFSVGEALVFGSETKGLGPTFLETIPADNHLVIPMRCTGVRSLNLSNAVSIVLYEALRQTGLV